MKSIFIVLLLFFVSGCVGHNKKTTIMPNKITYSSVGPSLTNRSEKTEKISYLTQCNRDLESLRTVDAKQYSIYLKEYDELMKNSENFLTVKDDISQEVASMARPRFQFALVNLCYRIKDRLVESLIHQAEGKNEI
ncbi:hypothetical protein ACFZFR_003727 [Salmonella enterica]